MSPRLISKLIYSVLLVALIVAAGSDYFSAEKRAYRNYISMRDSGDMDLQVIDRFIRSTETRGSEYYQALNLAATLDDSYLDQVITLYAKAQILLQQAPAERILSLLPSESIKVNTAAGRIMTSDRYGHEDPQRARPLLEYSALRGDRDAAGYLSKLYERFDCPVGAATWAQVANKREHISVCARIPVNMDQFTDEERQHLIFNQTSLREARERGEIARLKYSASCEINRRD